MKEFKAPLPKDGIVLTARAAMMWLEEGNARKERSGTLTVYKSGEVVFTSPNGEEKFKTSKAAITEVRPGQNGLDIVSKDLSFCVGSFASFFMVDQAIEGSVVNKDVSDTNNIAGIVGDIAYEVGNSDVGQVTSALGDSNASSLPAANTGIATAEKWLQVLQDIGFPVTSTHVQTEKESNRKILFWVVGIMAIIVVVTLGIAILMAA